jgi:para-nitrobenzyl esterase
MSAGVRVVFASLRTFLVCALGAYAALAGCLATAASAGGVIPTDNGPVRGIETPAVKEYLGIPYAAPPVGELRWRPPQPRSRWHGPLDASHFGNRCPQTASPFGRASNTEDCLYLNVYSPNNGPGRGHTKNLPVMFWIHGGGLTVGESDDYDPTRLVQQGVVVVTINYRLGILGFLAHPSLTAESGDHASGDYGLMDQQAALRWVNRNIAKFGGDSQNVTIFGESAGGLSAHAQLASPLAAGLFQHVIAQSGAYALAQPSLSQAEASGSDFAQTVGCSDQTVACLRGVPVATLLANQPTTAGEIVPNVDGKVLPQSIGAAIESGQFNRVPVIEGTNHDEFSIFYKLNIEDVFGQIPSAFYGVVVSIFVQTLGLPVSPSEVLAEYPIGNYQDSVGLAVTAIGTDSLFACPGRRAAQSLSQFVPTFAYEFNDRNAPQLFVPPASIPYGAYHAAELQYLFDSTTLGGHAPFNDDQEKLAAAMVRYWTQFAHAANPNSAGTPFWPNYTAATDKYQSLVPPTPEVETGFAADHKCAFWDSHSGP